MGTEQPLLEKGMLDMQKKGPGLLDDFGDREKHFSYIIQLILFMDY